MLPRPDSEAAARADLVRRSARNRAAAYLSFFAPVTGGFLPPLLAALGTGEDALIDLGAGGGALGAAARGQGWRVTAVERDRDLAAACVREVPTIIADAHAIPARSGAAAAVTAAFVLPHLEDLDQALAEARRVLRPGGRLLALGWAQPDRSPFTGLAGRLIAGHVEDRVRDILLEAIRRTHPATLRAAAERAGFGSIEVTTVDRETVLPSADAWWRGMVSASSGLSELIRVQTSAQRHASNERFITAAGRFAVSDGGELRVPVAAHLLVASRDG